MESFGRCVERDRYTQGSSPEAVTLRDLLKYLSIVPAAADIGVWSPQCKDSIMRVGPVPGPGCGGWSWPRIHRHTPLHSTHTPRLPMCTNDVKSLIVALTGVPTRCPPYGFQVLTLLDAKGFKEGDV